MASTFQGVIFGQTGKDLDYVVFLVYLLPSVALDQFFLRGFHVGGVLEQLASSARVVSYFDCRLYRAIQLFDLPIRADFSLQ